MAQNMCTTINDLPEPAKLLIFSFCSANDVVKSIRLVCKQWNDLAGDREVWQHRNLRICSLPSAPHTSAMQSLTGTDERFEEVVYTSFFEDMIALQYTQYLGGLNLTASVLWVSNKRETENYLKKILRLSPNLKQVGLSGFTLDVDIFTFMSENFTKLVELRLSNAAGEGSNYKMISKLLHLEKIHIENTGPCHEKHDIYEYIKIFTNLKNLKSLTLENLLLTSNDNNSIILNLENIESIHLISVSYDTDEALINLFRSCINLKSLVVNEFNFSDRIFEGLGIFNVQLKKLVCKGLDSDFKSLDGRVQPFHFANISKITSLKVLHLYNFFWLSKEFFMAIADGCQELCELHICLINIHSNFYGFNVDSFSHFCKTAPGLKRLVLHDYRGTEYITDEHMKAISHCQSLEILELNISAIRFRFDMCPCREPGSVPVGWRKHRSGFLTCEGITHAIASLTSTLRQVYISGTIAEYEDNFRQQFPDIKFIIMNANEMFTRYRERHNLCRRQPIEKDFYSYRRQKNWLAHLARRRRNQKL